LEFKYAEPRHVTNVDECYFYHHMDLPGLEEVGRGWDLRKTIDDYLGHFDFHGKRVLDVGTASGFLTFEMEKRGAEVVSFDRSSSADWQLVPFGAKGFDVGKAQAAMKAFMDPLRNGYWLAHGLLNSRARVYYGDIYNIPDQIGQFDVVFFGMVLPHLREPFYALAQTARLSRDAVIITQQAPEDHAHVHRPGSRCARGMPDHRGPARAVTSLPSALAVRKSRVAVSWVKPGGLRPCRRVKDSVTYLSDWRTDSLRASSDCGVYAEPQ
jgi:SAM-dependent methyltransferase